MRVLLVGIYDTNTVSLAPQVLRAAALASPRLTGHQIETAEFSIFSDSEDTIVAAIEQHRPDVVGFSTYIWNHALVGAVSSRIDATVIVGGPQITGIETRFLAENPGVDYVITGEGEESLVGLLAYLAGDAAASELRGVTGRGLSTPAADPVDLATLPPLYADIFERHPDITWVSFETSRGCPMGCGYCTWGYSRRMRYVPLDRVLDELDIILANPKIGEIYLCDSSLLLRKERALTILDHIIDSGSSKSIRYEFSPEQLDDAIIERMAKLPTNEFNFGVQSVNPHALEVIGRRFDRERFEAHYRAFIAAMPDAQITVDLIYGLPGDDLDGYLRSMDYAMKLPGVSRVLTNPLIVLPGSRFFCERDALGIELADDGSYLLVSNETFPRTEMTEARKRSFHLNLVYLNTALRDALLAMAEADGLRPTQVMASFFDELPFDLVDEDYPYTIPSVKEGFEHRNRVFGSVLRRFPDLVSAFGDHSGHRFDDILAGAPDGYTDQYHKYLRFSGGE